MSCDNYKIACDEILDLGCVDHCGDVIFIDIVIPSDGDYWIEYEYLNVKNTIVMSIDHTPTPLTLNMLKFPVNQEILFRIRNIKGMEYVSIDNYSYFKFKTVININN